MIGCAKTQNLSPERTFWPVFQGQARMKGRRGFILLDRSYMRMKAKGLIDICSLKITFFPLQTTLARTMVTVAEGLTNAADTKYANQDVAMDSSAVNHVSS
jgi:hypothetical protein